MPLFVRVDQQRHHVIHSCQRRASKMYLTIDDWFRDRIKIRSNEEKKFYKY